MVTKLTRFIKIIISVVAFIIIVTQFLIILRYKEIEKKQSELVLKLEESNKIIENKIKGQQYHISSALETEGLSLNGNMPLVSETFDTILLKEIVTSKPILIFRYTELNCNECVDKQIKCIQEFIAEFSIDQIAFFSFYQEDRNLGTFIRLNQIQLKVYKTKNLGINIENVNSPYFFLINKACKIEHVFIPDKENIEQTKSYLRFISTLLQDIA